jgi:hypothetical protein
LLAICAAPVALAQTAAPKKPKKGAKPAASASASASAAPEPPPPAPEPTPSASASSESSDSSKEPSKGAAEEETTPAAPPSEVAEKAGKKYYFVGLRYRGTIIPQFFENFFVDDGGTVYSNSIGLELDMRQDGRSMIPWLVYTDYGMGDTLFLTKGKDPGDASQYSVVNSQLKALYLGLDELWSAPLAEGLDFEYGFGVGIGFVFGNLNNNWVYKSNTGSLTAANGLKFNQCQSQQDAIDSTSMGSCAAANHQNAQTAKVGGFQEPNWFNGGSVPVVFPHIAIPDIGLRYKPIKQLAIRLHTGFEITGFFWGLNVDYELDMDHKEAAEKPKATDKGDDKGGGDQPEKPRKKKKAPDSDQESGSYYVPGRDTL